MPTETGSGALSRNAKPSARAIPIGKMNTQKTASGSRATSSSRTRTSSASGWTFFPGLLIAQLPARQRQEDVLEHGPPRRELLESGARALQRLQQSRDRFDQGGDADRPMVAPLPGIEGARNRRDEIGADRRVRGELQDVG